MINEEVFEYKIPKEYKKLINKGFISIFVKNLSSIWDEESIDGVIQYEQNTQGWYEAFTKACFETGNAALSAYYQQLPWYDSDLFDAELAEMIYEQGLVRRINYEESKNTKH